MQAVRSLLDSEFPRLRHVETSSLHRAVPNARHHFLPIVGTENKLEQLAHVSDCKAAASLQCSRHLGSRHQSIIINVSQHCQQ